jgi:hypothetical protein
VATCSPPDTSHQHSNSARDLQKNVGHKPRTERNLHSPTGASTWDPTFFTSTSSLTWRRWPRLPCSDMGARPPPRLPLLRATPDVAEPPDDACRAVAAAPAAFSGESFLADQPSSFVASAAACEAAAAGCPWGKTKADRMQRGRADTQANRKWRRLGTRPSFAAAGQAANAKTAQRQDEARRHFTSLINQWGTLQHIGWRAGHHIRSLFGSH